MNFIESRAQQEALKVQESIFYQIASALKALKWRVKIHLELQAIAKTSLREKPGNTDKKYILKRNFDIGNWIIVTMYKDKVN